MESRMIVGIFGAEEWYNEDGKLHRTDGPAVIWEHGMRSWWRNGKRHREDGPAVIYSNGTNKWWLHNKKLSFTEWADELNLDQKTRLEMVLKWNPE